MECNAESLIRVEPELTVLNHISWSNKYCMRQFVNREGDWKEGVEVREVSYRSPGCVSQWLSLLARVGKLVVVLFCLQQVDLIFIRRIKATLRCWPIESFPAGQGPCSESLPMASLPPRVFSLSPFSTLLWSKKHLPWMTPWFDACLLFCRHCMGTTSLELKCATEKKSLTYLILAYVNNEQKI